MRQQKQIVAITLYTMDPDRILKRGDRLYTKCREGGVSIYGESVIRINDSMYREWIPWRSKLGALLRIREDVPLPDGDILYLGAAQGTTVSHLSDITEGTIYAVEFSNVAFRKLSALSKKRNNIVPVLADAFHPCRYRKMVPAVSLLYQDVSQKDQTGMCSLNAAEFLRDSGSCILMMKARSVDVTARPEYIFARAAQELERKGFNISSIEGLHPFQKDHAAIISSYGP